MPSGKEKTEDLEMSLGIATEADGKYIEYY